MGNDNLETLEKLKQSLTDRFEEMSVEKDGPVAWAIKAIWYAPESDLQWIIDLCDKVVNSDVIRSMGETKEKEKTLLEIQERCNSPEFREYLYQDTDLVIKQVIQEVRDDLASQNA